MKPQDSVPLVPAACSDEIISFEKWFQNWRGVFANEAQARTMFDEARSDLSKRLEMCVCDDVQVHRLVTFFEEVDAWAADHPILVTAQLRDALKNAATAPGSLSLRQND